MFTEDFVDLTAFYDKEISEDDVWNSINAIAGKELLPTGEERIFFAIADTLKQKDHVIRGGGQNSKRQQINRSIYLSNIQEISKKAKYVGTENNSDFRNKKKKGTVAFHYFESTVKINENFYKVKIATAEYTQREIERLKKIGKLPLSTVSSETSNLQNIWLSSPNEYSISHGKKKSSKVPSVLYLYNIKEQSLGKNYLNKITNTIQKETRTMENQTTQTPEQKIATNLVLEKLETAGIEVITDKDEMRAILEGGKQVQKMAAYHGTSREIVDDESFSGYGTYVVSVNETYAKQQGMKIASKKYGDAFYVKDQALDQFLAEHKFSPYWREMLKQQDIKDVESLSEAILRANTMGNAELEKQQAELATLCNFNIIEYKREKTYLYSIDIPDNNGKNYLPYEKPIGIEQATKINNALSKLGTEWRVTRNDGGRQVYFDTLSKVFPGNQEAASKFLKECGFVGMEMNSSNYIVFDEKDININKRVQYMIDENGEVYGFTQNGKIYLDPDLMNSNTPVHEYTHIWDSYIQKENPELWEKGKAIFQRTHLWHQVVNDPNYAEIADDENLVLSEIHARITGKIAEQVLERIAKEDGEITKDRAINWKWETAKFLVEEMNVSQGHENETVQENINFLSDFLSMPMKDFMNGVPIVIERNIEKTEIKTENPAVNYELERIQVAGIEVGVDKDEFENRLAWLKEVNIALEMLDEEPIPIQMLEDDLKKEKPANRQTENILQLPRMNGLPIDKDNLSGEKSQEAIRELNSLSEKINEKMLPKDFLSSIQKIMAIEEKSHCCRHFINGDEYNIRISNHSANAVHARPNETSVVVKLSSPRFQTKTGKYLVEYVYNSKDLTADKQRGIIKGLKDWIQTGEYTDKGFNKDYYSPSEELWRKAKGIQNMIFNEQKKQEGSMENNFNYMPDNEYFANWENMSDSEKQESSTARKEHFDVFVKAMKEQGINNQQELDDYIQAHINDDIYDASPWMKPYGENDLKNLVRARQDFMKAHPEVFMGTQEQISELPEHDPTDPFPLDFDPPEEKPVGHYEDGKPIYDWQEEPDEVVDVYLTKDGKVFYWHDLIPESAMDSLKAVRLESELETTDGKINAYAEEIHSILSEFSKIDPDDWNIDKNTAVSLHHLSEVADIKNSSREESIERIKEYFETETYVKERDSLGEIFSEVIKAKNKNGYDFKFSGKAEISNETGQASTSSIIFGKTELPAFALITKTGLQNFEKSIVQSFDKKSNKYIVENMNGERMKLDASTLESIVNPEKSIEQEKVQVAAEIEPQNAIVPGKTKIPEFAMISQHGLQSYKDMVVTEYDPASKSWKLSNADGQTVSVTERTLKELTSKERAEKSKTFDENTPAYQKMLEAQYNDFFKPRENTANNFRHNFAVYCRKEANSPLEALNVASSMIKKMPPKEQRKTKEVMNLVKNEGETVNQALARMYLDAVKEVPLNENYITNTRYDKKIARPMYDTVSSKGEQIDRNFNLKVGDIVNNIAFNVDKTFGHGKERLFQNCTVVSASKEGNVVTLMDKNNSFYDVPRDTFLKSYAKQQKREQKQENVQRRKHMMELDFER